MSRILIIGGSGHIGSYLIPMLVQSGHKVINVSRGQAHPYRSHFTWNHVENIFIDRKLEESQGRFAEKIISLNPDIVIDLIAFELPSVQTLAEALHGKIEHYLFCSSIWVYGKLINIPSTEMAPPNPIDVYGQGKADCEAWLIREARLNGFPATCFRPGHIVGAGWNPINPLGNANPEVFSHIARGEPLILPNLGLETVHHVHAEDVASWIICAIENRNASLGEVFNVVSAQAINLRGYAEAVYNWFGQQPKLEFEPFAQWIKRFEGWDRETSYGHVIRSSCHCIAKSRQRLGWQPRYSSLEAIYESVQALIANGKVIVP